MSSIDTGEEYIETLPDLSNFDTLAIGPGLDTREVTVKMVGKLLDSWKYPVIIDADGLNAIKDDVDILSKRKKKTIITPHPGEMSKLSGLMINSIQDNRDTISQEFSQKWKVILVLKGYHTVISHYDGRTVLNMTGGPALATAGTGDVLLGTIAAFWSDNLKKPFDATATAVYLHGLAGDVAAEKFGEKSVIASDVVEILPEVIKIAQEKIDNKD